MSRPSTSPLLSDMSRSNSRPHTDFKIICIFGNTSAQHQSTNRNHVRIWTDDYVQLAIWAKTLPITQKTHRQSDVQLPMSGNRKRSRSEDDNENSFDGRRDDDDRKQHKTTDDDIDVNEVVGDDSKTLQHPENEYPMEDSKPPAIPYAASDQFSTSDQLSARSLLSTVPQHAQAEPQSK
mmetsp:Transcript_11035/g.15775  ORF Transcript_11035/g.15775 Transcript_11035/m.15775 type:complete len:179 (-) Transcript_11035:914-1450(-)|eukprot:CAMPEP_0202456628 /NCGR_PEP_ID=MMETSP1360-20130828/13838_1 /ASSEMBLY_ACC=CAM_ASM_000848 /TAXON_ID=515479 /ORGANISM="Licmophora paradoxa, Strain CCMP2313" /LENGTH=178 /DNA_ID=CAMNT_0049076487 /DNA_START=89 /DNA_END=625 /DNA_ORIENTATION=-